MILVAILHLYFLFADRNNAERWTALISPAINYRGIDLRQFE